MPRVLVLGTVGQVGRALLSQLGERGRAVPQEEADFLEPDILPAALDRACEGGVPEAVINAAAYTAVDQAEQEPKPAALLNAVSPGVVARWCAARDVPLVHYSTDYVYSGEGSRAWTEDDAPGPLGVYGRTKLDGDREVQAAGGRHLILRTCWVYDEAGKNFLNTMLRLGRERETLRVVADQHGAPTYAPDLAAATLAALDHAADRPAFPSGIYHVCGAGETTWHGFAGAIFECARAAGIELRVKTVEAIATADYPTPARRPANSRLDTERARRVLGVSLRDWREALAECVRNVAARA